MIESDSLSFTVEGSDEVEGVRLDVRASDGRARSYAQPGREAEHYVEMYRQLHHDFGTRLPHLFAKPRNFSRRRRTGGRC